MRWSYFPDLQMQGSVLSCLVVFNTLSMREREKDRKGGDVLSWLVLLPCAYGILWSWFFLGFGMFWGIIKLPPTNLQAFLGSPRHHCQCRAAMCSITAPEVECDITPHCNIVCPSWILVEGHKMWPWLRPTYWHKAANREFVSSTCKLFWTFLKMLKVFESHSSVYWRYCTDKSFWSFFQAHPSPTYTCWLSKVDTGSWITEVTCSGCKVCGKHIDPHFDIARTAGKDSL